MDQGTACGAWRASFHAIFKAFSETRLRLLELCASRPSIFPGQPGNVALAGDREPFFRELRNVRPSEEIMLSALDVCYRYSADSMEVDGNELI